MTCDVTGKVGECINTETHGCDGASLLNGHYSGSSQFKCCPHPGAKVVADSSSSSSAGLSSCQWNWEGSRESSIGALQPEFQTLALELAQVRGLILFYCTVTNQKERERRGNAKHPFFYKTDRHAHSRPTPTRARARTHARVFTCVKSRHFQRHWQQIQSQRTCTCLKQDATFQTSAALPTLRYRKRIHAKPQADTATVQQSTLCQSCQDGSG